MAQPSFPDPTHFPVTPRSALRRHAERGSHERALVEAIVDEALVCHVAVTVDGAPRVLPTAHARVGGALYLHGARANRLLGAVAQGAPACVTITLVDGLVFARSWFSHSMNFRSVVVHGAGVEVTDAREKLTALEALVDKTAPGRARETRAPSPEELRSTLVVRFPLEEASAKVRTGPPLDAPEPGMAEPWAGELPLRLVPSPPRTAPGTSAGLAPSAVVEERARQLGAPREAYERTEGELRLTTDPDQIDFELVHRFLAEQSYWAKGVSAHTQRLAMAHSLCFGLFRGARQIGFARVLTDHGRLAYLGDVFVLPEERGRGAGKWLVRAVLGHPELAQVDRFLLGTADAHSLYERFGFVRAEGSRYMVRRAPQGE